MPDSLGTALVDLLLNSAQYKKGLSDAEKLTVDSTKKMEKSLGGVDDVLALLSNKFMSLAKIATAAFSTHAIYEYSKEAAMLAARIETMSVVLGVVGKNAGYASGNMKEFVMGVKGMGITTDAAMTSVTQMAQAQLDLSKATGLARVAQDAAVVGNTNSSDAFSRLVYGIKTGQMEVLRTIGINVSFEQSYAKFAATINKTATSLNENEKMQARLNAVLTEGAKLQGVYEESMKTTGKLILSMPRYLEDFKERVGQAFSPALGYLVRSFIDVLQDLTKELTKLHKSGDLAIFANDVRGIFKGLGAEVKVVWQFIKEIAGTKGVLLSYEDARKAMKLPEGTMPATPFNWKDEQVRLNAQMSQVSFAPLPGKTEAEVKAKLTQDYLKSRETGYKLTSGDMKQIKDQTEEAFKATKLMVDIEEKRQAALKGGNKEEIEFFEKAVFMMKQRFELGKMEQVEAEKQQKVLDAQRTQAGIDLHKRENDTAITASGLSTLKTKNKELMDSEKTNHEVSLSLLKQENLERKDFYQEAYDFAVKTAMKELALDEEVALKERDNKIKQKAFMAPAAEAEYQAKLVELRTKSQAAVDKAYVDLEKSRFEILKKQYEDEKSSYAKFLQEKVDSTQEAYTQIATTQKEFESTVYARSMQELEMQKSLLDIEETRGATARELLPQRKAAAEEALRLAQAEAQWLEWFKGNPLFEQKRLDAIQNVIRAQGELANITKTEKGYTFSGAFSQQFKTLKEDWTDTAKSMAEVGIKAFRGMADALTEFVMGGKLNFADLTSSIIRDLIRIQIQENLVKSFSNINWGGMWAGVTNNPTYGMNVGSTELPVGHAGGDLSLGGVPTRTFPSGIFNNAPRFHGGLNPDEFPAILQRGEKVIPKGRSSSGNVQFNIINQSSQPVTAQQQGPVKFDGDRMIVSVVLKDLRDNGPIRQAMRAGAIG